MSAVRPPGSEHTIPHGLSYGVLRFTPTAAGEPDSLITEKSGEGSQGVLATGRVLAIHGSMDRGSSFRRLGRALPAAEILTFDRRGYDGSLPVGVAASVDDHARDALAVSEAVWGTAGPATDRLVVLGHSFGGVVALRVAELAPELVRAVVVFESPLSWLSWWPESSTFKSIDQIGPEAAAEHFLRRFLGSRIWDAMGERHRIRRRAEGAALVSDHRVLREAGYGDGFDQWPYDPRRLHVPVTVAYGSESMEIHQRGARELQAVLERCGVEHRLVEIPGAKHGAHLSHARALAALVGEVLVGTAPESRTDR